MFSDNEIFWYALTAGWVFGYAHRCLKPVIREALAELRQGLDR